MSIIFKDRDSERELYKGQVVELREKNYYDDSDFYAVVWDVAEGKLIEVEYDTTRFACGGYANRDLTEENKADMLKRLQPQAFEIYKRWLLAKNKVVEKGKHVNVTKGRQKGASGLVFWVDEYGKCFNYHTKVYKIGISPSGEKVDGKYQDAIWTYKHNCEVIDPSVTKEQEAEALERSKNNPYGIVRSDQVGGRGLLYIR